MERTENEASDWMQLAGRYRERARKYETAARIHLSIIVFTLVSGIVIFIGGERIGEWMFKSAAERDADAALTDAQAKLLREIAALADPAAEFIRSVPNQVRPVLEKFLRDLAGTPSPPAPASGSATAPYRPSPPVAPTQPQPQAEPLPAPPPAAKNPLPGPTAAARAVESKPSSLSDRQALIGLYERLAALHEQNVQLYAELAAERERQDNLNSRYDIEMLKKEAVVEVAQINAEAARDRAEKELEIAQAAADAQTNVASESTAQADSLNELIASSVSRIGVVVMVIWLIRIFLRDRQRYVQRSDFYLGLADAVQMSDGNLNIFKDLLIHVVPPPIPESGEQPPLPAEAIGQILAGMVKRPD